MVAVRPARQAAPFESGVKPPHSKIPPEGGTPELYLFELPSEILELALQVGERFAQVGHFGAQGFELGWPGGR